MATTGRRHSFDGMERPTNQLPRMNLPESTIASQTSSLHLMIKERLKALSSRDADLTRHIIKMFRQTPKLGGQNGAQIGLRRDDFFVLLKDVLNVPATQESAAALFTRCESSRLPVVVPCVRCAARARLRGCCQQQLSIVDLRLSLLIFLFHACRLADDANGDGEITVPEFVAAAGPNDETTESWNARGPWRAPVPIGGRHSLRLAPAPVSLNVGQLDRMVQAKIASFASRDADGRRQILRMFQKSARLSQSARLASTSGSPRPTAGTSSHGLELDVNDFNVLLNEILNIPVDLASSRALFERYDKDGNGSLAAAEFAAAAYPQDYTNSAATGSAVEARPIPVGSAQNSRAMASFLAPLKPLRGAPGFVSRAAAPAAQHQPWSGMMPPQQSTEPAARPEQHHFSRLPSSQTHWALSHVNSIESRQMRQQLQPPPTPTPAGTGVLAVTTATPTNSLTTKLSGGKGTTFAMAKDRGSVSPRRAEPTNHHQSTVTPATPSMPTPPSAPRNQRPRGKYAGRGRGGRGRDHTLQVYQVVG